MNDLNKQLPFISFICNKNYFYIFVYWLVELIYIFSKYAFSEYFKIFNGNRENSFVNLICNFLADLLAIFLVLYTKCSMNMENNNNISLKKTKSLNELQLLYTNTIKEKKNL